MMRAVSRFRPAFCLLLALGGCATRAANPRYPSLLPRAIETRSDAEPEAAPVAVAAADPATDTQVAALSRNFDETAAAFATTAAAADRAATAAKGDAVGGERWITAQAALADLDALRAATTATLTEIDDIAIARATAGQPPYPAIETLREAVQAATETQGARIAAIQARLPQA